MSNSQSQLSGDNTWLSYELSRLASRVEKLEQSNARMRTYFIACLTCIVLMCAIISWLYTQTKATETRLSTIDARIIEISGRANAALERTASFIGDEIRTHKITLLDQNDTPRVIVQTEDDGEAGIYLNDGAGRQRATLFTLGNSAPSQEGNPILTLYDREGRTHIRTYIGDDGDGSPNAWFSVSSGYGGESSVDIRANRENGPSIDVMGEGFQTLYTIPPE